MNCVDVNWLAERLKVSDRTIRQWDADGKLPPALRIGRTCRWQPEVIEAWLKAGCPAARADVQEGGADHANG